MDNILYFIEFVLRLLFAILSPILIYASDADDNAVYWVWFTFLLIWCLYLLYYLARVDDTFFGTNYTTFNFFLIYLAFILTIIVLAVNDPHSIAFLICIPLILDFILWLFTSEK